MASAKNRQAGSAQADKQRRELFDLLLSGLDQLADQAQAADMAMAARIFYTAKEDLVHWAVTMHFHESAEDRFINSKLYASKLYDAQKPEGARGTKTGTAKGSMRAV